MKGKKVSLYKFQKGAGIGNSFADLSFFSHDQVLDLPDNDRFKKLMRQYDEKVKKYKKDGA